MNDDDDIDLSSYEGEDENGSSSYNDDDDIDLSSYDEGDAGANTGSSNESQPQESTDEGKQKRGGKDIGKRAKQIQKIASKLKTLPALLPILIIILVIVLVIGLISAFLSMPGMVLENIKQTAMNIGNAIISFFDGNNVDRAVTEEDELELAQRINAMGYSIVGNGFTDVLEYDEEGTPTKLGTFDDGRNYLRAYLVANESTYMLSQWSVAGFWQYITNGVSQNEGAYTQGMLNLVGIDSLQDPNQNPMHTQNPSTTYSDVSIDREKEILRIETNNNRLWAQSGTYNFDLSTWTSRYGKPVELMLALHLATGMPDLTYDIATKSEFNTKVNIRLNDVKVTYSVVYSKGDKKVVIPSYVTNAVNTLEENGIKVKPVNSNSDEDEDVEYDLTYGQVEKLARLAYNGSQGDLTSLPRIESVTNHWFYNDITFEYQSGTGSEYQIAYEPESEDDILSDIAGNITLSARIERTFTQVAEPEVSGPNDNIKKLFLESKYYQFDGTVGNAREIANAKAVDNEKESYTFGGQTYPTETKTVSKQPVNFNVEVTMDDGTKIESTKNAFAAFSILEGMHSEASEQIYRNLQELLISLDYFTEEDFQVPGTQVLEWILPGYTPPVWPAREANEYGAFIRSKENLEDGFEPGEEIIAPADATITEVGETSIKLKLKEVDEATLEQLQKKLGEDTNVVLDGKCILDMEFYIEGINTSISLREGQEVKRGDTIGTTTSEDIHIILYNVDKSIVDYVEDYMSPSYNTNINIANPGPWFDPDYEADIGQIQKDIYKILKKEGFTDAAACAVLGIIRWESNFDINNENPDDQGYGLIQWTGGRRTALEEWCSRNGYDYRTFEGQTEYFIYELKESYSKENGYAFPVYETMITSNDLEECLQMIFCHDVAGYDVVISEDEIYAYGKSTQYLYDQRLTYAVSAYKQLDKLNS